MKILPSLLIASGLLATNCFADISNKPAVTQFIDKMATEHQFNANELNSLFQSVEIKDSILKAMSRTAEGMPWYKYRKIFMNDKRINRGVNFWQQHQETLDKVSAKYGVPAEIIVAIIGVETGYGRNVGGYRVIDALSTLGFEYPKRSKFFLSELKHFLLLCRDEKMNPLDPVGSYAGAMGMPQFMPSSFISYSADFEGDGKHDIWNNPADAIASVANYFAKHHWQTGDAVAYPVDVIGTKYSAVLTKNLKPEHIAIQFKALDIPIPNNISHNTPVKLLELETKTGHEYWLTLNNFYVISRYNHSALYSMAVYQLSQAILAKK